MAVQMTRAEYEATYGSKPPVAQPTQNAGPIRMTRAQYEATYGKSKTPVTPEKTFGQKVSGGIQKIFPGQKIGQSIGTLAGLAMTPKENRKYYDTSAPSVGQVLGDAAQIALTVGTAGGVRTGVKGVSALGKASGVGSKLLNKATIETAKTVGGRAVQNTAIGAGFGATTGIKEGKDFKGVLKDTAIGAVTGLGTGLVLDGAISAYGAMKRTPIKEIAKTERELQRIENNYQKLRKNAKFSKDGNIATRNRVAKSGVLSDATDSTGTIITDKAIKRYRDLSPLNKTEGVVRNNLERLGETIDVDTLERKLIKSVYDSGQQGANLESSLNTIEREIAGYRRRATPDGKIPLTLLHDAKIDVYNTIDFNTPAEIKAYKKTLAKGLKEAVEENSSFNVKEVNETLSPYLKDIEYLESLNGRKVKGGKLGKYSARIAGNIAGGIAGGSVGGLPGSAVGTIVGGEVGDAIQGKILKNTFGNTVETALPESKILQKAVQTGNSPRAQLQAPKPGQPRIQQVSGRTINLPSRTQSAVDAQSLANLKAQKIAPPSKIPSKVSISKSVAPKKLPSKPVAKTDSLLQDPTKYGSAEEFVTSKFGKSEVYDLTLGSRVIKTLKDNLRYTIKENGEEVMLFKILADKKGTGIGSEFMSALKEYSDKTGKPLKIMNPTNESFWAKFDYFQKSGGRDLKYTPKPKLSLKDNRGFIATGYKNEGNLTTKILKDLEGKTTVSKQYIQDLAGVDSKTGLVKEMLPVGIKKPEAEIFAQVLKDEGDKISVSDFAQKIKAELLPLKSRVATQRTYDNVVLPSELRGNVKGYKENLYESPIKTSAGENSHYPEAKNYFGHTRIEDMADNKTRRVIEGQTDLYQKGNLEREMTAGMAPAKDKDIANLLPKNLKEEFNQILTDRKNGIRKEGQVKRLGELNDIATEINGKNQKGKLQQYDNRTSIFRMFREEIKKAAQDGKTKLQFPTGETAMKIEGLGDNNRWTIRDGSLRDGVRALNNVTPEKIKVGETIFQGNDMSGWIITDVLGDGKFVAASKRDIDMAIKDSGKSFKKLLDSGEINEWGINGEEFDISGKVDTNNPIYKFYEKDVQKYLNKFGGKLVTDDKGVTWIEIPITKDMGDAPVEAFGKIGMSPLFVGAGLGLAGVATAGTIKKKSIYKNGK